MTNKEKEMTGYLIEVDRDGTGVIYEEHFTAYERKKAARRAYYISHKTYEPVYLLDEDRTGHVCFIHGIIDHREGEKI